MRKNISENISKNLNGKHTKKRLDHGRQSETDALKAALKGAIYEKPQKQLVISLAIKLLIKSQKSRELYYTILRRHFKLRKKT